MKRQCPKALPSAGSVALFTPLRQCPSDFLARTGNAPSRIPPLLKQQPPHSRSRARECGRRVSRVAVHERLHGVPESARRVVDAPARRLHVEHGAAPVTVAGGQQARESLGAFGVAGVRAARTPLRRAGCDAALLARGADVGRGTRTARLEVHGRGPQDLLEPTARPLPPRPVKGCPWWTGDAASRHCGPPPGRPPSPRR